MSKRSRLVAIALVLLSCAVAMTLAADDGVEIIGRHRVVHHEDEKQPMVQFDFPGVWINATIRSAAESVELVLSFACPHPEKKDNHTLPYSPNRFHVYRNDGFVAVIDTSNITCETMTRFVIGQDLANGSDTRLSVQKITEADFNAADADINNFVVFHHVAVNRSNGTVHKLYHAARSSSVAAEKPRRIEFIGDSITAGYCNDCHHVPSSEANTYLGEIYAESWAQQACRGLDAQCHTEAWSGRGLIRNCDEEAQVLMPKIFERAVATIPEWQYNYWDFANFVPQAVVINLGTNDYACNTISNITEFNRRFEEAYMQLLERAYFYYGEANLHVFLACGPMSTAYCDAVFEVIAKQKSKKRSATFLDHRGILTNATRCCGHPDIAADTIMANITMSTIASVLNW